MKKRTRRQGDAGTRGKKRMRKEKDLLEVVSLSSSSPLSPQCFLFFVSPRPRVPASPQ
ncbi:MAG: hypothetical protein RMY29_013295 [Nostoc sp. CreGUA01]|nr:hypothetical protein [Nostoc sp. CreGUA01]